jgi:F-type H+-transporting ATPase subunit a
MTSVKCFKSIVLVFLTIFGSVSVFASGSAHKGGKEEKEFNVGEMIMHHISDAHEWHLWGEEHGGTTIHLPVILLDGGLKMFSSSHFYEGELVHVADTAAKTDIHYVLGSGPAVGYAMHHEKIYKLNAEGTLHFEDGHVHDASKPLDFSITKNVTSMFLGSILICFLMFAVARFYKKNGNVAPRGIAKFLEPLILMVQDDIAKTNIGPKYKKFMPLLLTLFFFIWINNLLGLIPIFPGGANLTGSISVTLVLSVITLITTLAFSNKNYWKHIFMTPGVPIPLLIIMIPIELVGIITKPFALMIRLFANITAGHIVILALISIIFINKNMGWAGLSVPMALFISVLELLVTFLQAFLFTMLTSLFIGGAVEEHEHDHDVLDHGHDLKHAH